MKQQFDNQVISSFLMWFDHTLLEKGEAYYTVNSKIIMLIMALIKD
jgi:hypothetical protein